MIKHLLRWPLQIIKPTLQSIIHALSGEDGKRRRRADTLANRMLAEFHRLEFTKRTYVEGKRGRRRRNVHRVKFAYPLLLTHDELWCPLDQLPPGVTVAEITDEWVVNELEEQLNAPVRVDRLASGKTCFVVRINGSQFPAIYSINNVEIAPDAPALTVPFGVDFKGDPVFVDLIEIKHLLIAGATGGGKTTLQHTIITTIINRNTADDVELWLVDMKRTEFALYRPLLGRRGEDGIVRHIAVEPADAVQLLDNAFREIGRRNKLMEQHGCTNVDDLARATGIKIKRLVLLVDEFAILTTDSERIGKQSIGTVSTSLMARIAALGRSAGVTICIATQMVNKDVLCSKIRANFENRVCFSTADWRQSQMVIETSEANGLPEGRAILRREGRTIETQTCLIKPAQVRIEVDRISEFGPDGAWGADTELAAFCRDAKLLVETACKQFNGDMARAKVLDVEGVKGTITRVRFDEIVAKLERDGVIEAGGPRRPRKVARAFFGRLGLIDQLYGGDASQPIRQPVTTDTENGLIDVDSGLSHGDAENSTPETVTDTGYGLQHAPTHADDPPDETEEAEIDPDEAEDRSIENFEVWKAWLERDRAEKEAKKKRKKG